MTGRGAPVRHATLRDGTWDEAHGIMHVQRMLGGVKCIYNIVV